MKDMLLKLYIKFKCMMASEEGQDLVEYALIVALIALVCTSAVSGVATAITGIFTKISAAINGTGAGSPAAPAS